MRLSITKIYRTSVGEYIAKKAGIWIIQFLYMGMPKPEKTIHAQGRLLIGSGGFLAFTIQNMEFYNKLIMKAEDEIMTREELLIEKYNEIHENYIEKNKEFYTNPSVARIEPFRIADGLYYVGDKKVCIHLIDTGDGLILLDSGFLGATHLLVDSIWRAGFDPMNVRWIIHSHGHTDHYGASNEFRNMYGTKLAISKVDADIIRGTNIQSNSFPYAKVPEFDYEIEDGEIFELGNVKIRCVLTPGHTQGVLSFFFNVTDNGNTYLAGMYGGAGVNALTLPYIHHSGAPKNSPWQMLNSIEKIWNEPVVVHLGNHPYNNHTIEKREQQLKEGGNPFIAPDSWHNFLSELKGKVEKIIKDNEELEKKLLFN